jgi:hypothetical protein
VISGKPLVLEVPDIADFSVMRSNCMFFCDLMRNVVKTGVNVCVGISNLDIAIPSRK